MKALNEIGTDPGIHRAEKEAAPAPQHGQLAAKRARRLATVPAAYRKLFERSYAGKVPPRASIKAFCLECVGFERAAITGCTAWACPIWNLRPYRKQRK